MLFRWMGVHAAWPHFLVLCLVFEGMKRGGGGRGDVGRAGRVRHTAGHWQDPATWSMIPGFDIVPGCEAAAFCTSNTYGGTKACVSLNGICLRVCVCGGGARVRGCGMECKAPKSNYLYSLQPYLPSLPLSSSLKWVILAMALTGHGLDFDLCSCEAQIKDSIYCCFMAAGMMNGAVSRSNQASVSLPHILIAKVASHRSALLPSPCLLTSSFLCSSAHCLSPPSPVHAK